MRGRRARDAERQRGVHLMILTVLTVAVAGVSLAAYLYHWKEAWLSPILVAGLVVCWSIQFAGTFTPAQRVWVYAFVGWTALLLDGVHATALYDISILAALIMLLFSGVNDRRLLHVNLGVYAFCMIWQVRMILKGQGVFPDSLVILQIVSHALFLFIIYLTSLSMSAKRQADLAADDREIERLKTAQRHTEDFLAGFSRELLSPVKTVVETADAMADEAADRTGREQAENVLEAGRRLTYQVNDLIDYMEIETGNVKQTEEVYRVSSLINDVAADLELYDRTDLPEILLDVSAEMPAKLFGGKDRIRKILKQLIENAVKFTHEGGIYVHLYPVWNGNDLNLCLDVIDTGIGMTGQEIERIRTGAYQADADRTRRAGGLGLGFALITGLTRSLSGFTNMTSAPGEGTRVHISIPQKAEDPSPCMKLKNPERLNVVFYQDPAKFSVPVVRDYYAQMVYHVSREFRLTFQRVATMEHLQTLLLETDYTHLFTAEEEYLRDSAFFDAMAESMHVIVVAKNGFCPSEGSGVTVFRKPLYTFPLVMLLNAQTPEDAKTVLDWRKMDTSVDRLIREEA